MERNSLKIQFAFLMFSENVLRKLLSTGIILVFLFSCDKPKESAEAERPWEIHSVEPANFKINTSPVTLNDGTRGGEYSNGTVYYNTYVIRANLPANTSYQSYSIHALVPTNDAYGASISGYGMSLFHGIDGERERLPGDENLSSTIGLTTFRGVQYSVFEIVVQDQNAIANRGSVDKMIFAFNVSYFNRNTNEVVNEDLVNLEVFTDTDPSPNTGSATFWVNQDYGCGYIDVSITGYGTQTINSYFNSNQGCGAQGAANFTDLPYGTYSYTASGGGCSWNNSFTIGSDCSAIQLTL